MTEQTDALIKSIADLEGRIAKLESEQKEVEQQRQSAHTNRNLGGVVLIIGLVLLVILPWYIGAFLIAIGGLTYITGISKEGRTKEAIKLCDEKLSETKREMTETRLRLEVSSK